MTSTGCTLASADCEAWAQLAPPEDRTARTDLPPARAGFGLAFRPTGDWLLDTVAPDQTRLRILTENLACPLTDPGTEDARTTAQTVRDIVRCLQTYLTEIELNDAAGLHGFTCEGGLKPPV